MKFKIAIVQKNTEKLNKLVKQASDIVVIQADNPDGDSLASALALEEIFVLMGKKPHLYCSVDIPDYLKHLRGWDKVSKEIPTKFDLSVIVDTSANILLEKLNSSKYKDWVSARSVAVIDHHSGVQCDIPYASLVINDNGAVATGEVIYKIAEEADWELNLQAKTHIVSSILSDSLGLSSEGTTPQTYRIMANLVESGVDRQALEEARRALQKMPESIFRYKGTLIDRAKFYANGRVALVTIPFEEILLYSPLYNPAPLIQTDMLQTEGVGVAIVLKSYKDGKVTGSIRCGYKTSIAADLAQHFGGGGHSYASGFKVTDGRTLEDIKSACITKATELLGTLEVDDDKTVQHTI